MARRASRSPRHVHESERLSLPKQRPFRLAVVADTHSRPHPKIAELLDAEKPDAILHGGDIGDLSVLEELAEVAPVTAVRGNIDERAPGVPDSVDVTFSDGDEDLLRLYLTHIAVRGPKLRADVARRAEAHGASIVVCGHSHVPFIGRDRGMTIFNPGSIGPRRFTLPVTYGVMHIARSGVKIRHMSCETGEPWQP